MKVDNQVRRAIRGGKDEAAELLARRKRALNRRRKAVAKLAKTAAFAPTLAAPQHAKLVAAAGGSASRGTLVAEGDSWFDYPRSDVLDVLEDDHGYDVDSVAHRGDTVEDMAYSGGQLDDLVRTIDRCLRRGIVPKAVLLSGGGNDIAGDEFAQLLNHAASTRPGLNESIVHGVIDERLKDCYLHLLGAVTEICRAQLGAPIRIVTHGYAYAVPDGRGFLGGWGPLPGPWLKPGFDAKGYPKDVRQGLVDALIDRFAKMQQQVASLPEFAHVRFVDLRKVLPNEPNHKDWWANELHPSQAGFALVAKEFAKVIP